MFEYSSRWLLALGPMIVTAMPAGFVEEDKQTKNPLMNDILLKRRDNEAEEENDFDDKLANGSNVPLSPIVYPSRTTRIIPPTVTKTLLKTITPNRIYTNTIRSTIKPLPVTSVLILTSIPANKRPQMTGDPSFSRERAEYMAGTSTAEGSESTHRNGLLEGATSVHKSDPRHTRMEVGVAFTVILLFIAFGVSLFFYYRAKGRRLPPKVSNLLNRFRKNKAYDDPPQQTDFFRQPTSDAPMPKRPAPVALEGRDPEKAISPSTEAPMPKYIEQTRTRSDERRRTRDNDLQPYRLSTSPPRSTVDRSDSKGSNRSKRSVGLPIGGPRLNRNPSESKSNPFADRHSIRDPFRDGGVSPDNAPAPLRLIPRTGSINKPALVRSNSTTENVRLTDPRVADNRTLIVANGINRDSLLSPMPPPPPPLKLVSKKSMKQLSSKVAPLRLEPPFPVGPAMDSRFSWTTKAETPSHERYRKSDMSSTSTDSAPAKFRGVNSWVNHQTDRLDRHPEEGPGYAKTVTDYDARSDASDFDTRRTYYKEG